MRRKFGDENILSSGAIMLAADTPMTLKPGVTTAPVVAPINPADTRPTAFSVDELNAQRARPKIAIPSLCECRSCVLNAER